MPDLTHEIARGCQIATVIRAVLAGCRNPHIRMTNQQEDHNTLQRAWGSNIISLSENTLIRIKEFFVEGVLGNVDGILSRLFSRDIPILIILILVNIYTFFDHYMGSATFPWDFLGGYHAHTYGWYSDGSFFDPPSWFPWGDSGFPAYWAVQAGGWYLPLEIIDAFDFVYTIQVATRLQVLHVLFASIGMYYLLKLLGYDKIISLIGAVAFHYTATFYSNQQHPDIIRGASLIPWMMIVVYQLIVCKKPIYIAILSLIIFQFLVGSYPGVIVSVFYTITVYSIMLILFQERHQALRILVSLSIAATAGALMGLLKWAPLMLSGDLTAVSEKSIPVAYFTEQLLPTLALPYRYEFLPFDITMRSLWIPVAFVVGIGFTLRLGTNAVIAVALVVLSWALGGALAGSGYFPGDGISRFPLSDWRPVFHIGLIIGAAEGWSALRSNRLSCKQFTLGIATISIITISIAVYSKISSFPVLDIVVFIGVVTAALLASTVLYFRKYAFITMTSVLFVTLFHGLGFHRFEGAPWIVPFSVEAAEALYGVPYTLWDGDRSTVWENSRPGRYVIGEKLEEVDNNKLSNLYNKCWYVGEYCLMGYNNRRNSQTQKLVHNALFDSVYREEFFKFMSSPSQTIILPDGRSFDEYLRSNEITRQEYFSVPGAEVEIVSFSSDSLVYLINAPVAVQFVENEVWDRGWAAELVASADGTQEMLKPSRTGQGVRVWQIPPGNWRMELRFVSTGYFLSWTAFGLGVALALIPFVLRSITRFFKLSDLLRGHTAKSAIQFNTRFRPSSR